MDAQDADVLDLRKRTEQVFEPARVSERVAPASDHLIQRGILSDIRDDPIDLIGGQPTEPVEADTDAVLALAVPAVGSARVGQQHQQPPVELADGAEHRRIGLLVEQVAVSVRGHVLVLGVEDIHPADSQALLSLVPQIRCDLLGEACVSLHGRSSQPLQRQRRWKQRN